MKKLTKKQQKDFTLLLVAEAEALTGTIAKLNDEDAQWARFSVSDQRTRDALEGDMVTVERVLLSNISQSSADGAQQVARALRKLEEGTYGLCDDCGGPIPLERLEARPRSVRCVKCS